MPPVFPLIVVMKRHLPHSEGECSSVVPTRRIDVESRVALIKILPIQNAMHPGSPLSCLMCLLHLGAFKCNFSFTESLLATKVYR